MAPGHAWWRQLIGLAATVTMLSSFMPGESRAASGRENVGYEISVAITTLPIDLARNDDDPGQFSFGTVDFNTDEFSNLSGGTPRCTLQNLGWATVDYGVSVVARPVTPTADAWTLGTVLGDTGPNRCVLAGIFTRPLVSTDDIPEIEDPVDELPYKRDLVLEDFGDEDVLGPTVKYADDATPDVLARNDTGVEGEDDAVDMKGFNASPPNTQRSLRFMLQTVHFGTTSWDQEFLVTLSARIAQ